MAADAQIIQPQKPASASDGPYAQHNCVAWQVFKKEFIHSHEQLPPSRVGSSSRGADGHNLDRFAFEGRT